MASITTAGLRETSGDPGSGRPRVAFLIHDLGRGGAERVFVSYLNGCTCLDPVAVVLRPRLGLLDELSRAIPLFDLSDAARVPRDRSGRDVRGAAREEESSRPDRPDQEDRTGREPFGWVRKAIRLHRLVRREGCDTVVTFLHKSHALALVVKVFAAPDLRVVVNVHEMLSDHVRRHFGLLGRALMLVLVRVLLPRADRIVAVSDGVRDDMIEHFGVPARLVVVATNPVPTDRIRAGGAEPVEHPFVGPGAAPLVVGVGRLVPLKGYDVLLRAFAGLADARAHLLVVGEGAERTALERQASELGVDDRVSFVGFDPNPWRYMARADVFVLPSLTEALPNVVAEALVLGRPIVATRCSPGVADYLADGEAGVLVPPGDADALRAALERLLGDAGLRSALSRRALDRARHLEGAGRVAAYERLLLSTVPSRPAS